MILNQLMKVDLEMHSEYVKKLELERNLDYRNTIDVNLEENEQSTTRSQRLLKSFLEEVRRLENSAMINFKNLTKRPYILIIDFSKCVDIDTSAMQTLLYVINSEQESKRR